MPRYWASVVIILCRIGPGARPWGAYPTRSCLTWHPKGNVAQAYDLWNEERGVGRRAVLVVDKEGMDRFRQTYAPGTLPDPEAILQVLESIE